VRLQGVPNETLSLPLRPRYIPQIHEGRRIHVAEQRDPPVLFAEPSMQSINRATFL
jgi:hypothetical protein